MARLGLSCELAEILAALPSAPIVKLAGASQVLCAFRFRDHAVLSALTPAGPAARPDRESCIVSHANA